MTQQLMDELPPSRVVQNCRRCIGTDNHGYRGLNNLNCFLYSSTRDFLHLRVRFVLELIFTWRATHSVYCLGYNSSTTSTTAAKAPPKTSITPTGTTPRMTSLAKPSIATASSALSSGLQTPPPPTSPTPT
nr:hypothetical protein HmN_000947200 [Hymenolepis microstoma]